MTSKELKEAAGKFGADLIGIAAVGNLNYLPKEDNPLSIFPQATNVIVIGRKIPRGAIRGCEQGTELNNTFTNFGFMSLEDNLLARPPTIRSSGWSRGDLKQCRCSDMIAAASRSACPSLPANPRRTSFCNTV